MLPILVNERDIENFVIKKRNQSILFVYIQLLEKLNFPGGVASLCSLLDAYKLSETKNFFPNE